LKLWTSQKSLPARTWNERPGSGACRQAKAKRLDGDLARFVHFSRNRHAPNLSNR
jgi:hypothetical protein